MSRYKPSTFRPVDLAREHGLSAQAVRNYEAAGILPPAERSPSGYRRYTLRHAQALRTFVALVPAHGHAPATAIMVAVNEARTDDALELIDRSHAQLLEDRRTLDAVEHAARELVATPAAGPRTVGALARSLGIRPATLRRWEREGLLRPERDAAGYRTFSSEDVRDARFVHQLRRGGYLLAEIAPVLAEVRSAGGTGALQAALAERRARHGAQARAMLAGAAELGVYLKPQCPRNPPEPPVTAG